MVFLQHDTVYPISYMNMLNNMIFQYLSYDMILIIYSLQNLQCVFVASKEHNRNSVFSLDSLLSTQFLRTEKA